MEFRKDGSSESDEHVAGSGEMSLSKGSECYVCEREDVKSETFFQKQHMRMRDIVTGFSGFRVF